MNTSESRSAKGWGALAVWLGVCAVLTVQAADWRTDNRIDNWIGQLESDEAGRIQRERFGGDEMAVLRLADCALESENVSEFVTRVARTLKAHAAVSNAVSAVGGEARGPLFFRGLEEAGWLSSLNLVDEETRRLDYLIAVRTEATPEERGSLASLIAELRSEAESLGMQVRAAGHPLIGVALDEESKRVETFFAPALALLAFLGTALFLRSLLLALVAILPAVVMSSGARAVLSLTGVPSDLILVALGPLNFVLTLAATLHFVTAYRRYRRNGCGASEAVRSAVREKLGVGTTAALTTAIGFGVFSLSELNSVSRLGLAVACSVLFAVPLVFGGLAPLLAHLPIRATGVVRGGSLRWRVVSARALRVRYAVLFGGISLLVAGAWSAKNLETETNALHYFPRGSELREDFMELEAAGRALSSVDVLLQRAEGAKWTRDALRGLELGSRFEELELRARSVWTARCTRGLPNCWEPRYRSADLGHAPRRGA